jgi:hypothetical protein
MIVTLLTNARGEPLSVTLVAARCPTGILTPINSATLTKRKAQKRGISVLAPKVGTPARFGAGKMGVLPVS